MKSFRSFHPSFPTVALAVGLLPSVAEAQFFPRPPWHSARLETIGGVSYFTFGAQLPNCHFIQTGELGAFPGGFRLSAWQAVGDICLDCFDCEALQTNSIVLGKLAPGSYTLVATTPQFPPISLPGDPVVYQAQFVVPATVEPTLHATRVGDQIRVDVAAADAAEVSVLASRDLLRWAEIPGRSAFMGSGSLTLPATNQFQFFRARISSGTLPGGPGAL